METVSESHFKVLNRDVIKYIAMFTMLLNHIATIFLKPGTLTYELFISIGYFTGTAMIYFLVEGYYYTHSKKAYILRLFIFAVISEIPYCLAFTQDGVLAYYNLNMLFTLCLCFGLIWIVENVNNTGIKNVLIVIAILGSSLFDWALLAPLFTLSFIRARNSEKGTKMAFVSAVLIFAASNFLGGIGHFSVVTNLAYTVLGIVGVGLAGICIVYLYNGKRMNAGRNFAKWFFYIFYPAHLLVLGIIRVAGGM